MDGIPTLASSIPLEGLSEGQLAWAGVGQAKDSVNPLSMLVYMGAVANGGRAAVPRLIHRSDASLIPAGWGARRTGTLIAPDTAQILSDMMAYNVTSN